MASTLPWSVARDVVEVARQIELAVERHVSCGGRDAVRAMSHAVGKTLAAR